MAHEHSASADHHEATHDNAAEHTAHVEHGAHLGENVQKKKDETRSNVEKGIPGIKDDHKHGLSGGLKEHPGKKAADAGHHHPAYEHVAEHPAPLPPSQKESWW